MTAERRLLEIVQKDDAYLLSGEIDLSNVDQLATTLATEVREGNHLVLDCSGLRFIDSTGMSTLLAICRGLGDSGRLTLRDATPPVAKAAHVLGLDRVPNLELTADTRPVRGVAAGA